MDITVLSAIINIAWYIGTSLFLLYKFTSLFSYAINFSKFCWRLLTSVRYLSNLLFYKKNYTLVQTDDDNNFEQEISHNENISFFSKIKNGIKKVYHKTYHYIFNKHHPNSVRSQPISTPLTTYETTDSSMYINNSDKSYNPYNSENSYNSPSSLENHYFYKQMDNLDNSEYTPQISNNMNYTQRNHIYQSYYYNNNTLGRSYLNKSYTNQSLYYPEYNNNNSNNNIDSNSNSNVYSSDIKININLQDDTPKNIYNVQDSNELFKSQFINHNIHNNMPFAIPPSVNENENEKLSQSTHSIYKDPLSSENQQLYNEEQNSENSSEENMPLLHNENYI